MPNVVKWNSFQQRLAGEIKAYVDDLRAIGWYTEHAWRISRWVVSRLQYLGIQDAGRKRRVDHGPWAGTIFLTSDDKVQRTVQQSKWTKAKDYIISLDNTLSIDRTAPIQYKLLERIRGF